MIEHYRWKIIACVSGCILAGIFVYASLEETFFLRHADTETIAREWIYRNMSPSFRVSGSLYATVDPYDEYEGEREAGEFFVSRYPGGMPVPESGILVKEFSLENKIFSVTHRNPPIKVFVIPGEYIKEGFKIPPFPHCPARKSGTGFIFLNGRDFGIDPLEFQIRPRRKLILVSGKAVEKIAVSLTNNFAATVVKIKVGWKMRRMNLAPYETKMVLFKHPRRGFPFTKYFYKLSIDKSKDASQVFVKIGADSDRIGRLYYEAGLYEEAIEYLIEKDLGTGELTLISEKILRDLNTTKIVSENLNSHRGGIITDREASSKKCIAITCKDGEEDCIYGPYYGFSRGSFTARYRLKISDVSSSSKIKLDVAGRLGTKVIAQTFLKPQETEGFINAELPFCIDTAAEILEFRITLTGKGTIVLDYVEVFPDVLVGAAFMTPAVAGRINPTPTKFAPKRISMEELRW